MDRLTVLKADMKMVKKPKAQWDGLTGRINLRMSMPALLIKMANSLVREH